MSVTGKGVTGTVGSRSVALGNAALMADLAVELSELDGAADRLRLDGATVLFAAAEGRAAGVIAIIVLLGIALPMLGITLLIVWTVERTLLRRWPAARAFLSLRPA